MNITSVTTFAPYYNLSLYGLVSSISKIMDKFYMVKIDI